MIGISSSAFSIRSNDYKLRAKIHWAMPDKAWFSSWECRIYYYANMTPMELGDSFLTLSLKQRLGNVVPGWYHWFPYIWAHVCQKYSMYFLICIPKYGYAFWHGPIWSCLCMMCLDYRKYTSGGRSYFWQVILLFMCHSTLFAVWNGVHSCMYSLHSLQLPREHLKSPGILEPTVAVSSD